MPSKTVVFVSVFLSALAVANAITCKDDAKGNTECSSNYCFVSVSADKDLKTIKKCADAVPEHKKHEVNEWIRSGGNYVYICDTPDCNNIDKFEMQYLKEAVEGKLVCQKNKKANDMNNNDRETLKDCITNVELRCAYTKNLETNEVWQNCGHPNREHLLNNMNKCFKTDKEYVYYCDTTLCNNAHVCDQLELGKPSPFGELSTSPAPGADPDANPDPDQSPPAGAPGQSQGPAVSTPKNTGSAFNLPTIVVSVLVVGICYTFW